MERKKETQRGMEQGTKVIHSPPCKGTGNLDIVLVWPAVIAAAAIVVFDRFDRPTFSLDDCCLLVFVGCPLLLT